MMEFLPLKTLVASHVILVMSYLVVRVGPVRVMEAGVVVMLFAIEVSIMFVCKLYTWLSSNNPLINYLCNKALNLKVMESSLKEM